MSGGFLTGPSMSRAAIFCTEIKVLLRTPISKADKKLLLNRIDRKIKILPSFEVKQLRELVEAVQTIEPTPYRWRRRR